MCVGAFLHMYVCVCVWAREASLKRDGGLTRRGSYTAGGVHDSHGHGSYGTLAHTKASPTFTHSPTLPQTHKQGGQDLLELFHVRHPQVQVHKVHQPRRARRRLHPPCSSLAPRCWIAVLPGCLSLMSHMSAATAVHPRSLSVSLSSPSAPVSCASPVYTPRRTLQIPVSRAYMHHIVPFLLDGLSLGHQAHHARTNSM
jgi:hypothetical protein